MEEALAYIINSSPGVGKSTLLKNLHLRLPDGFAIIDGDDVGRVIPYQNDINWLNLIQDNIADCCHNYKKYGFKNCIIGFVFPSEERLKRITELLSNRGFQVKHIIIECDGNEIERRIVQRNTSRIISVENAKILGQNMKTLFSDFKVDTTSIDANRVAEIIIDYIRES